MRSARRAGTSSARITRRKWACLVVCHSGGHVGRQSLPRVVPGSDARAATRHDEVDAAEQRKNAQYELGRGEGQEL